MPDFSFPPFDSLQLRSQLIRDLPPLARLFTRLTKAPPFPSGLLGDVRPLLHATRRRLPVEDRMQHDICARASEERMVLEVTVSVLGLRDFLMPRSLARRPRDVSVVRRLRPYADAQ